MLSIRPLPAFSLIFVSVGAFLIRPQTTVPFTRMYYQRNSNGQYESTNSFMVREFANYDQLQKVIQLASKPLPERPDGIVTVAKYTSNSRADCRATEAEYDRLARTNPATIFMRCFVEYEGADLLISQANVAMWPTFDVFYGGNRVARVEGPNYQQLQAVLEMYQLQNSRLDLFSEDAYDKRDAWESGKLANGTPATSNRFIPGYDWNSDRGFADVAGDKFQAEWDKIYGEWTPDMED